MAGAMTITATAAQLVSAAIDVHGTGIFNIQLNAQERRLYRTAQDIDEMTAQLGSISNQVKQFGTAVQKKEFCFLSNTCRLWVCPFNVITSLTAQTLRQSQQIPGRAITGLQVEPEKRKLVDLLFSTGRRKHQDSGGGHQSST